MILVSACLCGINCKYNSGNNENPFVSELVLQGVAIPICPEVLGGLRIPRSCCEIVIDIYNNKKVFSKDGRDVTNEFIIGAEKTLQIAKIAGVTTAILKSKSPSCGSNQIYDGSFSGRLLSGKGITTELLETNGIKVYNEDDYPFKVIH